MLSYATSKSKAKAVRQLVQTLCIFYFEDVTSRELDVLCEMVHHGVSGTDSRDSYMINYRASKESFFQVKDRLTKKGILQKKQYKTGKELHPYFENIKQMIDGNLSPHNFEIKIGNLSLMTLDDKFVIIKYDVVE
jgi:hypothetical protein